MAAHRFAALRKLRALERRMRALAEDWKRFRTTPDPHALRELNEAFAAASRKLAELSHELGGGKDDGRPVDAVRSIVEAEVPPPDPSPATSAGRPTASEIVRASRRLDGLVMGLAGRWKEFQRRYAPEQLSNLEENLRSALARADVLAAAIIPDAEDHPGSVDGADAIRTVPPDGELEARRKALDAILWRITSDWQHLRKRPTSDRMGVLRDQIREALLHAEGLSHTLGSALAAGGQVGPVEAPAATDAVRFYPYRDGFTGTYNRAGFDGVAGAELKRCRRYERPFGLIMVEAAPTELEGLRRRIAVISEELRAYDILARYVDRSIVIGLPETTAGETRRVAVRVMRALHENVGFAGSDRIGLAVMPDDEDTLSGLMATARRRIEASAD